MQLSKRTVYCLLAALMSFNVLVRLPRTYHETGVDSFFIHNLATAISDSGHVPWVLNALGYFGWYPLSYPTAGPLLISGLAQTGGYGEEGAILLLSLMYGGLGVLVAFGMARTFLRDDVFAISVALIFSLAPRFMSFTLWSASTRNLFMVLIPIFIWALIKSYRKPTPSYLFVLFTVLVLMIATHRLTILLAVVVLAFVVAYVFILINRVARVQFPRILLSKPFKRWTPWLTLGLISAIALFMLVNTEVLSEYSQGEVCVGASTESQVCNLGVSVTRSVGLALPLALVGVFDIVRRHNKGFLEAFLVFSMLSLIPTLFLRQYTGFYILPFLALFAGLGLLGMVRALSKYRRASKGVLIATLLSVAAFGVSVLQIEIDRGTSISEESYTTGLYLKSLPAGNFVANDGLMTIRVASISSRSGLPVGGAGVTSQSPELLIMGAFEADDILPNERRIPLTELTIEDDSPFILDGIDARIDWQLDILYLPADDVHVATIEQYSLQYLLENDELRGAYIAFDSVYRGVPFSNFQNSVYSTKYKLFDGTTEDIYLVFPPLG